MADGCDYLTGQTIAIEWSTIFNRWWYNYSNLDKLSDDEWEQIRTMIRSSNTKDKADRG